MKKLFLYAWLAVGLIYQVSAQSGTINVSIQGIKNTKGTIRVALYNSEIGFLDKDYQFQGKTIKPSVSGVRFSFQNIPEGTYAIAVLHDENNNGRMDKKFVVFPAEDYGFSRSTGRQHRRPRFEDVSFKVEANQTQSLIITLK